MTRSVDAQSGTPITCKPHNWSGEGYCPQCEEMDQLFDYPQQQPDIQEPDYEGIGREWCRDSSLDKWFPFTAEEIQRKDTDIARLRTELEQAKAERDQLREAWDKFISLQTGDAQLLVKDALRCRAAEAALSRAREDALEEAAGIAEQQWAASREELFDTGCERVAAAIRALSADQGEGNG